MNAERRSLNFEVEKCIDTAVNKINIRRKHFVLDIDGVGEMVDRDFCGM